MASFDLQELGTTLLDAGRAINEKVTAEIDTLEFSQINELSNRAQELVLKSKELFATAVIQLGEEVQTDLEALQDANKEIAQAIKKIGNVQKIVNISAGLLTVASNIIAGDFKSIPKSAQAVLKELKG